MARLLFVLLVIILPITACKCRPSPTQSSMPKPDINAALRAHDKELMAIPGVVGVYVGLLPDQKTPCLKVMAARRTAELERAVPKSLEGYPVVVEETGVIRPMQ